jgi:hypothetical protein
MTQGRCPLCRADIRLLDATSPLSYGGTDRVVHHKCLVENQELLEVLAARYPGVALEEALARFRTEGP